MPRSPLVRLVLALAPLIAGAMWTSSADARRLPAPALSSPAADATVAAAPAFTWNRVPRADHYEFQLAADRAFASVVLGRGRGLGAFKTRNTAATITKTIPDGEYFWRVRAVDANDRASSWSAPRPMLKAWTTAPQLESGVDELAVSWPAVPLVLRWTEVPYAVNYIVTIATDRPLSSEVLGSAAAPLKTRGNVFALPDSLSPGEYHWAITPLDAAGHRGTRSRVGSFTWSWPTKAGTRFKDLNTDPRVMDPEFSWDAVPGAARYEVEINPDEDFAPGSRVCCDDPTTGTSLSPSETLRDNTYYWRVRAFDANGNAGIWNGGPPDFFTKNFDTEDGQPSIRNLRVREPGDLNSAGSVTSTNQPVVVWDPVPGASGYEVQALLNCDSANIVQDDFTATPAWTPLGTGSGPGNIGPASWGSPSNDGLFSFFPSSDTRNYCIRVRAFTSRASNSSYNGYISLPTDISFTATPRPSVDSMPPAAAQSDDYLGPVGVVSPRMPVFAWKPIDHARGYIVVVARDADFINVVDHAYTQIPAYAPRKSSGPRTYADETTSYYWAVIPYNPSSSPQVPNGTPPPGARASFHKQSAPPTPLSPVEGAGVSAQPRFAWTPAEGARSYQLQVAQDPTFGNPLDDVKTDSTSYTSSTTYPADTLLYWRVRATDETGIGQSWSTSDPTKPLKPPSTFQRTLSRSTPDAGNPTGGERIPVLSWSPVAGAVSYDMLVDRVDGKTEDFTVRSTSFTPTAFYGNGIWRWRVRANFPTSSSQTVGGPYFAPQDYVRKISAPANAVGVSKPGRYVVTWAPDPAATEYRVEVSRSSGFTRLLDRVTTDTTAFAPDLNSSGYRDGGRLFWRVASEDTSNVGAFATGKFVLPRAIHFKRTDGSPRKGQRTTVTLKLTDAAGRRLRNVRVEVAGAGTRSDRGRTNRRGIVRLQVRPTRAGRLTFTGSGRGIRTSTYTLRVF